MGRKVVADQALEERFNQTIKEKSLAVQRGLLIGHVSTQIAALIRIVLLKLNVILLDNSEEQQPFESNLQRTLSGPLCR